MSNGRRYFNASRKDPLLKNLARAAEVDPKVIFTNAILLMRILGEMP